MRIVIELKRGEESQLILNNLFKHTQMQESFHMILLSIVGGQPREMGLIEIIRLFIEHRREVVRRRTRFDLRKARRTRAHIDRLSGRARSSGQVIRIIRGSSSRAEAKENLFKFFTEAGRSRSPKAASSKKIEGVKLDGRKYRFVGGVEDRNRARGNTLRSQLRSRSTPFSNCNSIA